MTRMQRLNDKFRNSAPDVIVTQAALARELGCNRSSICRYVKRGLPTLPDGRLYRRETLEWIKRYTSGFGGGWFGDTSIATQAARLLRRSI